MQKTETVNRVHESDIIAHIEDTRLFWVFRHGRNQKVCWNELTAQERADTLEAERRDYYCTLYSIY